jgi:BASS family bile acid:Na+ symporter
MDKAALFRSLLEAAIVLTGFSLGLRATPGDALCVLRNPGNLIRAVAAMNVAMPVVALALAWSFPLHPAVKIALFALAVSPLPPTLPRKALKAGGREDYTVGILVTASAFAIVLVPVTLAVGSELLDIPLRLSAWATGAIVFKTVLAPVFAGILVRLISPRLAELAAGPIGIFATAILMTGVIIILFAIRHALIALVGDGTLLMFVTFAVAGLGVGHLLGGPQSETRSVLALCTASRHPAVAAAIVHANFPQQPLPIAAVVMCLLVGEMVSAIYLRSRRRAPQPIAARRA